MLTDFRKAKRAALRREKGAITVEFICLCSLLVVAGLVGVMCYLLLFAASQNDASCRDAARAAAQQTNQDDAKAAAAAACLRFNCGTLGKPQVSVTGTDFEYETFPDPVTGDPQIDKGPFVKITTVVSGKMPFNLELNRAFFGDSITFKRSYVFPLMASETAP